MRKPYPLNSKYAKDLIVGDKIHYSFTVKTITSIETVNSKLHIKFSDDDCINCGPFHLYFICDAHNSDDFTL